MKRKQLFLLSLLSALLLSVPYFRWGSGLLLMGAFVPLLYLEDLFLERSRARLTGEGKAGSSTQGLRLYGKLHHWLILAFGTWVLLTTYWVYFATWVGIAASLLVNTSYMVLTFLLFHFTRRRLGDRLGYASFVIFWLAFEFLYTRAQFNFPWLLLGNGFARDILLIQWYEITGTQGGTLWVLLTNLAVFQLVKHWLKSKPGLKQAARLLRPRLLTIAFLLLIPVLWSVIRFFSYEEKGQAYEMVVLQPNIDPWLKFNDMPQAEQTERLIRLADSLVTPRTEYIVGPETFINNGVWQEDLQKHPDIRRIQGFLADHPRAKMVIGATTLKLYRDPAEYTSTSRPLRNGELHYDSFNSAMQLDESGNIPLYHKSRLVAGVEHMPHKKLLGFLEKLTVQLGGTFRSQATQPNRGTFASPQDSTLVGPVICWESVFAEYVTGYVKEAGAQFLFIITNDGWWRKTAGHRQHNAYARLRAIENRRAVARSANTGISSLINQKGQELQRIGWWETSAIRGELVKNERLTFYTRHGDYMGRAAVFVTIVLLLYALLQRYIMKEK